jgi:hypothetical protein
MNDQKRYPSYVECVTKTLSDSPVPLSVGELMARVEEMRPVDAGGRNAVYRAMERLYQVVSVEPGRYGWLSSLMSGSVFRHPLTRDEIRRGYLMLDELEHAVFCPDFFQGRRPIRCNLTIALMGGPVIEAYTYLEKRIWSVFLGPDFVQWVDEQGANARDDIIVTVEDAIGEEDGVRRYHLRLQPHEARDPQRIQGRNIQLALDAEEIVAANRRQRTVMPTWDLAAHLIGRGFYRDSAPPDDLHHVLDQYSMLHFVGELGYSMDAPPRTANAEPPEIRTRRAERPKDSIRDLMNEIDGAFDLDMGAMWLDPSGFDDNSDALYADTCPAYELYLDMFEAEGRQGPPLTHQDFHILEAELEYLLALEVEFGGLLPEQQKRKNGLADRLFIDPDSWPNDDFDIPDSPDYWDPPHWEN